MSADPAPGAEPRVALALPGEWVTVRPREPEHVAALTAQAPEGVPISTEWLAQQAAAGTVLVMFRLDRDPAVVLTVTWPPGEESGATGDAALRARCGDHPRFEHVHGYSALRYASADDGPDGGAAMTYALTHPRTGRLLVLRVAAVDGALSETQVAGFDLVAGGLTWAEA